MCADAPRVPIQPIVLVGGRSSRFGRDKLREPYGGGWLVDRSIAALRAVFGPCVAAVGECDPEVAARADLVLADRYPGVGPAGGILSTLEATGGEVFVLAGDLPEITAEAVRAIVSEAAARPDVWAVLAHSGRPQPCIGIYRSPCIRAIRRRLAEGGGARLWDLIPGARLATVAIDAAAAANVNTPDSLDRGRSG